MFDTPILFLIFNRPDTTKRVFEAIRNVKPKQLFIAADGPRSDREGEKEKCEMARSIALSVDWNCEVKTLFRDKNIGCKIGPSSGIDWFFSNVEYGIILEDDCVPHASFFPYCEELLQKYDGDTRIMMISGINFSNSKISFQDSYFFSRYHLIWGWATWKRAWNLFDIKMVNLERVNCERYLQSLFSTKKEIKYWKNIYSIAKKDILEEWDYKWAFALHANNSFCICPNVNLVQNIGQGPDATHTKDHWHIKNPLNCMNFPLRHPVAILRDTIADKQIFNSCFRPLNIFKKILRRLLRIFKVSF